MRKRYLFTLPSALLGMWLTGTVYPADTRTPCDRASDVLEKALAQWSNHPAS